MARSSAISRPACSNARSCRMRLNCRSLVTKNSEEAVAPCLQTTFLVRASSTLASTRTVTRLSNVPCKVNASVGMTTDVTCPISTRSGASESATTWTPPPAENSRRV